MRTNLFQPLPLKPYLNGRLHNASNDFHSDEISNNNLLIIKQHPRNKCMTVIQTALKIGQNQVYSNIFEQKITLVKHIQIVKHLVCF